jgi:hypothetical protein
MLFVDFSTDNLLAKRAGCRPAWGAGADWLRKLLIRFVAPRWPRGRSSPVEAVRQYCETGGIVEGSGMARKQHKPEENPPPGGPGPAGPLPPPREKG